MEAIKAIVQKVTPKCRLESTSGAVMVYFGQVDLYEIKLSSNEVRVRAQYMRIDEFSPSEYCSDYDVGSFDSCRVGVTIIPLDNFEAEFTKLLSDDELYSKLIQ